MLRRLERRLSRYAVPHLTVMLIIAQVLGFVAMAANPNAVDDMRLVWERVAAGEVWRLVTFLCIPPASLDPISILFAFFALYLFYIMGTALDNHWGTFRYNLYILVAYVATVAAAAVDPTSAGTHWYIGSSVFLAFAYLYPDFEILLFLILPVKVKWLALITWILLGVMFLGADWQGRALIAASVLNFFLFFGRELFHKARRGRRRMARRAEQIREAEQPFHACVVCGRTDRTDPDLEFRYCPRCAGAPCYCIDHIHDHEHR